MHSRRRLNFWDDDIGGLTTDTGLCTGDKQLEALGGHSHGLFAPKVSSYILRLERYRK